MLPAEPSALRARLDEAIRAHDVSQLADAIRAAAEPQVLLFEPSGHGNIGEIHKKARAIDPSIPAKFNAAMRSPGLKAMQRILEEHAGRPTDPGASRVGGAPDLPPDLEWPTAQGKHLTFIAQIDLSSLPRWTGTPLPERGWLWAFAGGKFPIDSAVLHWDGDRTLLRPRPTPTADAMALGEFVSEAEYDAVPLVDPELVVSVPGYSSARWDAHVATANDTDLEDRVMELTQSVGGSSADEERGCAVSLLGDMSFDDLSPTELAVKYGKRTGDDWVPLLEVGSVGSMLWSDEGTLAFLIRAAALRKGDLSVTYAVVSSS